MRPPRKPNPRGQGRGDVLQIRDKKEDFEKCACHCDWDRSNEYQDLAQQSEEASIVVLLLMVVLDT
jgi:hypothetical protein